MARKVELIIVCEDILHEAFMRAFLYKRGFTRYQLKWRKPREGGGDAKQHVCELLRLELEAIRKFSSPGRGLVFVIDADNLSTAQRRGWVEKSCSANGTEPPRDDEPVFGVIPKWEIENWLAYLRDGTVDEESRGYDKYRNRESMIYPLVEVLADKCAQQEELPNAPPSLIDACIVYGRFAKWKKGYL